MATKFCIVAPIMCGFSVSNLLHFTLQANNFEKEPRFLEYLCTPALQLQKFETLAQDGSKWSTLHIDCFILGKRNPTTYCIRDWVGPSDSPDILKKRKICCPCHKSNSALFSLITILTELILMQ